MKVDAINFVMNLNSENTDINKYLDILHKSNSSFQTEIDDYVQEISIITRDYDKLYEEIKAKTAHFEEYTFINNIKHNRDDITKNFYQYIEYISICDID